MSSEPLYTSRSRWRSLKFIPKRFLRSLVACLSVSTILMVNLCWQRVRDDESSARPHPFVDGNIIHQIPSPYPLQPFPYSPMETPREDESISKPWLAAVMSAAHDVQRRMIIRSTWMRLYRDIPFDKRFIVSNPGPNWIDIVAMENRTFGDIIVLDHLHEDHITANTVKTLELYKWLIANNRRYKFVSKVDTDLWLNAREFWDRYLVPKLFDATYLDKTAADLTIIGQLYYNKHLTFPHGALYTVTWDVLELLVELQNELQIIAPEDMAIGLLMRKGKRVIDFIHLSGEEKFDYADGDARGDGTAWARKNTWHEGSKHALYGENIIAVHQLKENDLWFKVAKCFDEGGVKRAPPISGSLKMPSILILWHDFWHVVGVDGPFRPRIERIPNSSWSQNNGSWIVDGVWNMGEYPIGYI